MLKKEEANEDSDDDYASDATSIDVGEDEDLFSAGWPEPEERMRRFEEQMRLVQRKYSHSSL